jgi:hypothetical protein
MNDDYDEDPFSQANRARQSNQRGRFVDETEELSSGDEEGGSISMSESER